MERSKSGQFHFALSRLPALAFAFLLPFICLAVFRCLLIASGTELEQDCFYHARVADFGPGVFSARSFPALTLSLWSETFADKELGYHFILAGLRSWQAFFGMDMEPPFNFPALAFSGLAIAAFVYACRSFRVRSIWLYALALAAVSPYFCFRLMLMRPHVLAIAIMLVSFAVFLRVTSLRGLWVAVVAGMLMAYCYSSPHFLLVPACAVAAARLFKDGGSMGRTLCLLPVAVAGGIALGYVLHPQFPFTFSIWWAQGVATLMNALHPGLMSVSSGNELNPPGADIWVASSGVILIVAALAGCVFRKGFSTAALAAWLVALFFCLVFVRQPRGMEYACPFSLLALALAVRDIRRQSCEPWRVKLRRHGVFFSACALAIALSAFSWLFVRDSFKGLGHYKKLDDLAKFLDASGVPAGVAIANVNWSDFPTLFYSAPQYRYLCGLEPMFGYMASPERMSKIEAFRTGRAMLSKEELAALTNSPFAFVSLFNWKLAESMSRNGYPVVYQGRDGWLFELVPPTRRENGQP